MVTLWGLTCLNHSLSCRLLSLLCGIVLIHEWFYDAQFAFVNKNIWLHILGHAQANQIERRHWGWSFPLSRRSALDGQRFTRPSIQGEVTKYLDHVQGGSKLLENCDYSLCAATRKDQNPEGWKVPTLYNAIDASFI